MLQWDLILAKVHPHQRVQVTKQGSGTFEGLGKRSTGNEAMIIMQFDFALTNARAPFGYLHSLPWVAWWDEYLQETTGGIPVSMVAPQTFHMGSLQQEMKTMEAAQRAAGLRPQAMEDLAPEWTEEFMEQEEAQDPKPCQSGLKFSNYYCTEHPCDYSDMEWWTSGAGTSRVLQACLPSFPMEFSSPALIDEYCEAVSGEETKPDHKSNLQQVAQDLVSNMQNSKLSQTKFMSFVKILADEGTYNQRPPHICATTLTHQVFVQLPISHFKAMKGTCTRGVADNCVLQLPGRGERMQPTTARTKKSPKDDFDSGQPYRRSGQRCPAVPKYLTHHWGRKEEDHPWLGDYEDLMEPYRQYIFTPKNPLLNTEEPFQEGLKKLKENDIPSAVLLFEANVQKNPEHILGWQYLGITQAENEKDSSAIAALKRCLQLDPGNLPGLMSLATSYLNEAMHAQVCETLCSLVTGERISQVLKAFLQAARLSPMDPDPDVQCGLGILFNVTGEFDKAADCFTSALSVRPKDSLLWNRLGASLANGRRSEEAVTAYHRALELSPGFIRSRFNLGISCINLGAYKEAAEHFLVALNLQNQGRGPTGRNSLTSDNIWGSLGMATFNMDRPEVSDAVSRRDLPALNRLLGMDY
ncbi:PEX5 [Cordylochernes scorpioides]|uniref:PEX5 n=1 Tax=Cordylochernes scorpioides TaxID=51811 RepID=A0ABY6KFV9_9ARAC|nr:PEX5 [Cordylochernes scorpioides]